MPESASSLRDLLDQIEAVSARNASVTLGEILRAVGRRSFGPFLVLAGLIILAPIIGDIPGVPTIMGLFVAVVAAQIVIGRDRIWLPQWLLARSIRSTRLRRPLQWLEGPARWLDDLSRTRLQILVGGVAARAIAAICVGVAVLMPVMEVVPFSANAAGLVLVLFGLALIAGDGLLALLGAVVVGAALVLIGRWLL